MMTHWLPRGNSRQNPLVRATTSLATTPATSTKLKDVRLRKWGSGDEVEAICICQQPPLGCRRRQALSSAVTLRLRRLSNETQKSSKQRSRSTLL